MKKTLLTLLVAAAPAVGFSQVELISGFNFGQFVFSGAPSTDGLNGTSTGFIRSNFTNSISPGPQDSGIYKVDNGIESSFSAGSATIYWNGTNGSDAWGFESGTDIIVVERGALVAVNHNMVNGLQMFGGDDNNAALRLNSTVSGNTDIALVINTVGFTDFDAASFAQPNDFNFTFSAYAASGASASIEWILNGSSLGVFTANPGEFQAFNLDLPAAFYGDADATLIGRITGDIVLDNIQPNGVASAIPEPSAFAALAGVCGLGLALSRRRRQAA